MGIINVQPLAGGVGASILAENLQHHVVGNTEFVSVGDTIEEDVSESTLR
jgi:hypothetical protein